MLRDGLFIDGFAGGGGASTGIARAIGRDVDIAINHNPLAIAIHKANHPGTEHHCQDIRALWPRVATKGQPVAGAWFSPDCKEFSKAKGGPVKDRSIRALCWEVIWWLDETRPEVGYLENVEEFEYAAPLDGNGIPMPDKKGREFKRFVGKIRRLGYRVDWRCLRACDYGAPTSRKRLYMVMRKDRQRIVWPKASHAPANDNRVLRGELLPYRTAAECIDWSIPCPSIFDRAKELADATKRRIAHGVMRYVVNAAMPFLVGTAFTNTRASRVFNPADPLRTATTQPEFGVVDAELASFVSYGQQGGLNRSTEAPFHAVTASSKDTNGIVGATLVGVGGRRGQSPPMAANGPYPTTTVKADGAIATAALSPLLVDTAHGEVDRSGKRRGRGHRDIQEQMPAQTQSGNVAQVSAFLHKFAQNGVGKPPREPLDTAMAGATRHAVVAAHLEQANGGPRNKRLAGRDTRRPMSTATTTGSQQRIVETTLIEEGSLPPEMMARAVKVAAFLIKYYGTDGDNETAQIQEVTRPIDVVTTKARYAVVTVTIDAVTYVIVDIGLRMLKPRELARAQGFPESYVLDPIVRKFLRGKWVERRLTIAEQISAIGNSVCPDVAAALVAANQPGLRDSEMRMAA